MKKEILALVVTYNRKELLVRCLKCLMCQSFRDFDILIVDNCSTDGTDITVRDFDNTGFDLTYKRLDTNTGGAGGFNYGMRYAAENGYKYCWLMDDDCLPDPDGLEELINAKTRIGDGNYGYLSSAVFWTDGSECKMNRQKTSRKFYENIQLLEQGIIKIDQATFVSLFLPIEIIEEFGLPIKEYYIWSDDIEYTRRISVRGRTDSYLVSKSHVTHAMVNNEGSQIAYDSYDRIERYNYAFRNDNCTYRREGFKGFMYYTGKCGINMLRIIAKAKDHKAQRCWIVFKWFFAGLFFNPRTEYVKAAA